MSAYQISDSTSSNPVLDLPRHLRATYSKIERLTRNAQNQCYAGYSTLAGWLSVSEKTIRRHITALEQMGVLIVRSLPGVGPRISVQPARLWRLDVPSMAPLCPSDVPQMSRRCPSSTYTIDELRYTTYQLEALRSARVLVQRAEVQAEPDVLSIMQRQAWPAIIVPAPIPPTPPIQHPTQKPQEPIPAALTEEQQAIVRALVAEKVTPAAARRLVSKNASRCQEALKALPAAQAALEAKGEDMRNAAGWLVRTIEGDWEIAPPKPPAPPPIYAHQQGLVIAPTGSRHQRPPDPTASVAGKSIIAGLRAKGFGTGHPAPGNSGASPGPGSKPGSGFGVPV